MAGEKQKNDDLYGVLGLNKECTEAELKNAYKKLALKWHPDRCSASGNSKFVEEAKKKFQVIQKAYSVLSDGNRRLMYDLGVYDSDDDDNAWNLVRELVGSPSNVKPLFGSLHLQGMGDFLSEMVAMMDQTKPKENGEESFEKLQELFQEMFNDDVCGFGPNSSTNYFSSPSSSSYSECSNSSNKRNSSEMNNMNSSTESYKFDSHMQGFSMGEENAKEGKGARTEIGGGNGRREKTARAENRALRRDDMSDIQRTTIAVKLGLSSTIFSQMVESCRC